MSKVFALAVVSALFGGSAALAQYNLEASQNSWQSVGSGSIFNNDYLGEMRDRWQTASTTYSMVRGYGWDGDLPDAPGEIVEYRIQGRIIAPGDVENPVPGDRLYSTSYSLGTHTHFNYGANEVSLGADLVITGEQTGLPALQTAIHNELGRDVPSDATLADMIPDGVHPGVVVELGRPMYLSNTAELRPFAELRTGDETLFRSGVDVYFGGIVENDLLVRDQVTGQRYRTARGDNLPGLGFVVGGDIAQMGNSIYFPSDRGPDMIDNRTRLRAGVMWQGDSNSVFYGMTWLSEEFDTQPEPQFVGSIRLKFEF